MPRAAMRAEKMEAKDTAVEELRQRTVERDRVEKAMSLDGAAGEG